MRLVDPPTEGDPGFLLKSRTPNFWRVSRRKKAEELFPAGLAGDIKEENGWPGDPPHRSAVAFLGGWGAVWGDFPRGSGEGPSAPPFVGSVLIVSQRFLFLAFFSFFLRGVRHWGQVAVGSFSFSLLFEKEGFAGPGVFWPSRRGFVLFFFFSRRGLLGCIQGRRSPTENIPLFP